MELFIQTITNMMILSSVYILVSLGFAFLFNMLGILNLAHGPNILSWIGIRYFH